MKSTHISKSTNGHPRTTIFNPKTETNNAKSELKTTYRENKTAKGDRESVFRKWAVTETRWGRQ